MLYFFYACGLLYAITVAYVIWVAFKHWRDKTPFVGNDPDE